MNCFGNDALREAQETLEGLAAFLFKVAAQPPTSNADELTKRAVEVAGIAESILDGFSDPVIQRKSLPIISATAPTRH